MGWRGCPPDENITKLSDVPRPSTAMVFVEEADSRTFNAGTWMFATAPTPDQCGWIDTPACFHINASSFDFADGHAEMHKWLEPTTITAGSTAANGVQNNFGFARSGPNDRDINWVIPRYQYATMPASEY